MINNDRKIYRILQKHLDTLPVGYPATRSGVEIRILQRIFTPVQAAVATALTHRFEPVDRIFETIEKQRRVFLEKPECEAHLDEMAKNGGVFCKTIDGRKHYALVPFVVGMYEFQVTRLTPGFYEDAARYFREGYALAYLSTAVPQMRVIPVEQSVGEKQHIATYDEVRRLIADAGERIGVADCICRKGKDLTGEPCRATDRRRLCIGLRDYFDTYSRHGWLRQITRDEAMEILSQCETEGLVLQATNEQKPQAICACCGCCCGVLSTLRHVPNRVEFAAGNFYAKSDPERCVACGKCAERCHMDAIVLEDDRVDIDPKGCIGCGVCVPVCKKGAMALVKRQPETVPPEDTEALYDTIMAGRKRFAKARTGLKILRHMDMKRLLRAAGSR